MFGGARETVAVVNKNARVAFRNAHVDDVTFLCRACVLCPRRTMCNHFDKFFQVEINHILGVIRE